MNLVLDTNVLIAAFISQGSCHALVERCLSVHSCITSEFILNELREKLTNKFKFSDEDAMSVEAFLRSRMQIVEAFLRSRMQIVEVANLEENICRDPDDDQVLGTAIAGKAVCIITGDKDLLTLQKFGAIDILSPSEFMSYEEK